MLKSNCLRHKGCLCVLILCLMILCSCQSGSDFEYYEYSADTYLTGDTPFENVARQTLPSISELKTAEVTYYEHVKQSNNERMHISVVYTDEDFDIAKQKIDEQYQKKEYWVLHGSFCFDGIPYKAYMFYVDEGRYIMAYHICSDSNSISYVLSEDWEYEFLTVAQGFEHTYGEHRITPMS